MDYRLRSSLKGVLIGCGIGLLMLAAAVFLISLSGCVTVHVEKILPDGSRVTADYNRYILPQRLEGVLINLDTGEALIEKQQSDTERLVGAAVEGAVRGLRP
ncbi:MAG: hypothetical protein JRE40_09555 [Deltaproteobacteria bacterium]|nr:hypothetical protein [Deltaproteobacteria bacterium]